LQEDSPLLISNRHRRRSLAPFLADIAHAIETARIDFSFMVTTCSTNEKSHPMESAQHDGDFVVLRWRALATELEARAL